MMPWIGAEQAGRQGEELSARHGPEATGRQQLSEPTPDEGQPGVGHVEAFSDGVLAIIVTIMVLELKAPDANRGSSKLWRLWPVLFGLSAQLRLCRGLLGQPPPAVQPCAARDQRAGAGAQPVSLLFALSLIPVHDRLSRQYAFRPRCYLLYLATMLLPSLSYIPLQHVIRATGAQTDVAQTYHRQTSAQGQTATAILLSVRRAADASSRRGSASACAMLGRDLLMVACRSKPDRPAGSTVTGWTLLTASG